LGTLAGSNWETDIALIKSDIKQIQKFFNRVEDSMDMMAELSKNVAVQNEVLENTKDKLEDVEKLCEETKKTDELRMNVLSDRLEEYRRYSREDHQRLAEHNANKRNDNVKEILDRIDRMETAIHKRINDQQKKINHLENWRYYMMGIGFVIILLVARINWPSLFG
jgi:S-adenosylmethionine/arginine decarboxylase-like enzyme